MNIPMQKSCSIQTAVNSIIWILQTAMLFVSSKANTASTNMLLTE